MCVVDPQLCVISNTGIVGLVCFVRGLTSRSLWQCKAFKFYIMPVGFASYELLNHLQVPAGSPSCGEDVAVYVFDINQPSLPTPFYSVLVCFCLYGPFNCISFHEFTRQLFAFSLWSSGLISALFVLSTVYLFMKNLSQSWYNPLWLTGLKASTN